RACNDGSNSADQAYKLDQVRLAALECPSDPSANTAAPTNYAFCVGPNMGWGIAIDQQSGMFNRNAVVSFRDITDGTANTIAVSEQVTYEGLSSGPKDLTRVREGSSIRGDNGAQDSWPTELTQQQVEGWGQAALALTAINGNKVGERWWRGQPGRTAFSTLLTPNSTYPNVTFHCSGCNYDGNTMMAARSMHAGGVHSLMGDGSVRFLNDNINWTTYQYLGSRNDGGEIGEF
ncbi:DUF1559 domain-containing protein, partial [bacterium]|nr:DUF1559 domain-containing protein [bacterium]